MKNREDVALIVDDEPANLKILAKLIDELGIDVSVAESGERAIEVVSFRKPSIVLMDIMMPNMDGYETVKHLLRDPHMDGVPILYVTALNDSDHKTRAFRCGGHDYITKPFDKQEVQSRVRTHLQLFRYRQKLENTVQEQVLRLDQITYALVSALESANSFKDDLTGYHIRRVGEFSRLLSLVMGLGHEHEKEMQRYAPLHDIGKIGVPDRILQKPGSLTREERAVMEQHVIIGYKIIKQPGIPETVLNIVRNHHERWDGTGYPDGLKKDAIPVESRIVAVADVYDALRSRRPYKEPFDHDKARVMIEEGAGTQFDPSVVSAFLDSEEEFALIYHTLQTKNESE